MNAIETTVGKDWTAPARHLTIDRDALRDRGYLPEVAAERWIANSLRLIRRSLVAKVRAAEQDGPSPRAIMIGSALPEDGKTFISLNLALSVVRERVVSALLVDADLGRSQLTATLGLQGAPGLSDALVNPSMNVESLVIGTDLPGFSILPAGQSCEAASELLGSSQMTQIRSQLLDRAPNRLVLFDSAPLLASSESVGLAAQCGQVLLVVRAGKTPLRAVEDAAELLDGVRTPVIVINDGRKQSSAGYYGYYGYHDAGG